MDFYRQIDTSLINADLAVLWDDTEGLYMVNTVDPPLTTQVGAVSFALLNLLQFIKLLW